MKLNLIYEYLQYVNYFILWSKITEVITIIPPIKNKIDGTSPKIRKLKEIPKIGKRE